MSDAAKPLANARHERFAQALAKGTAASVAYVEAGYVYSDGNCIRLKGDDRIKGRVAAILAKAADRVSFTLADAARQLDEDRAYAQKVEQAGAAVSATVAKLKLFGLIDKSRGDQPNIVNVIAMDPSYLHRSLSDAIAGALSVKTIEARPA